jgi:hypothetical protein
MKVTTYEGIVENGLVRLPEDADIPDHTKVYIIIPTPRDVLRPKIHSPRLADPRQAAEFAKEVTEEPGDARI